MMSQKHLVLLNPGPVNVSKHVRQHMEDIGDMCHREDDFFKIVSDCHDCILELAEAKPKDYVVIFLTCSGTGANEAMVSHLQNWHTTIVNNGIYGERLCDLKGTYSGIELHDGLTTEDFVAIKTYKNPFQESKHNPRVFFSGEPYTLEKTLVVHHETSIGYLDSLERYTQTQLFVDAISSFGVHKIDLYKHNVGALTCTANKCIHGLPGISFIICKKSWLKELKEWKDYQKVPYYFDLLRYYDDFKKGTFPFTPATHTFVALWAALNELHTETIDGRLMRYQQRADAIRKEMQALGYAMVIPERDCSSCLTAFYLKDKPYKTLHDFLHARGFVIYAGQGKMSEKCFRIANMGEITMNDVDKLIETFKELG